MALRQYKRLQAYINRDEFEHVRGRIDPKDYHSMFITWAKLFSVIDCEKLSLWMYVSPISAAISAIAALALVLTTTVHCVQTSQLANAIESGTYVLLMIYQFLIAISVIKGRKRYHNLLRAFKDDFQYIVMTKQKYRKKFFENQRLTFKIGFLVVAATACVGVSMSLCACATVAVTVYDPKQDAQRPLPYPFWLFDYNLHASPTYEVLFIASMVFTFWHTYMYAFMALSHVIWIREITCKADIITWNIQDLLVDVSPAKSLQEKEYYAALIKRRMREIIDMHHSMFRLLDDYAAVYKKCLFYEQTAASPTICMTAFCFVQKYEEGEIKFLLLMLCIGIVVLVFVPNYLCTFLLEKVQSVSDACWNTPFWNAGPVIRPYLVLIMQRSMRPLPLAAPGFAVISLNTFATIITRAYSWFTILRQADLNFS